MSDVQTLAILDGAATPVSQDFLPESVSSDQVDYRQQTETSYYANPSITISRRRPSAQNGNFKATIKVKVPVMDTSVTPAVLSHEMLASLDVVYSGNDIDADRSDLIAFMTNAISTTQFKNALKGNDFPF